MSQIKKTVREVFSKFVFYTGLFRLFRFLKKNEVVILNYHNIQGNDFERHIVELLKHYKIISLEECVDCLKGRNDIEYGIVITFDDGYESFYSDIFPLLKEYKIPAAVFLATNFVGSSMLFWFDLLEIIAEEKSEKIFQKFPELRNSAFDSIAEYFKKLDEEKRAEIILELSGKREEEIYESVKSGKYKILNWTQVKEMHESGLVNFGAHTLSHPILSRVSSAKAQKEISESKSTIEKNLQTPVRHFAYPNGDSSDFNQSVIDIIRKEGFDCALTTINGNCRIGGDLFTLKRKAIDGGFDNLSLLAKITGLWIALTRKGI